MLCGIHVLDYLAPPPPPPISMLRIGKESLGSGVNIEMGVRGWGGFYGNSKYGDASGCLQAQTCFPIFSPGHGLPKSLLHVCAQHVLSESEMIAAHSFVFQETAAPTPEFHIRAGEPTVSRRNVLESVCVV